MGLARPLQLGWGASTGSRQRRGQQEGLCDSYPCLHLWGRTPSGPCMAVGWADEQGPPYSSVYGRVSGFAADERMEKGR